MIAYTIIGGYLGAGKTTLLNCILAGDHGIRFALVINDFGEINIDANLIESQTGSQINLTNGCVCCSLTDGFHEALEELQSLDPVPEHIVVEASGVADVTNLAQYGRAPGLRLDGVLVLADAETLMEKANNKYVGSTIKRQLACADLIVLNKRDLVSKESLQASRLWLEAQFPNARLIETDHAKAPLDVLLGTHETDHFESTGHHHHEAYATWRYQSNVEVSEGALLDFVLDLPDFVIRAKGFAQLDDQTVKTIQIVGARKEIDTTSQESHGVTLIAIGLEHDFQQEALDMLAARCFG
jgi:G3E family GTPase